MLTIRPEQFAALAAAQAASFENRMVVHLNRAFEPKCREMGEPKVRETIRQGVEKAASYGITVERDVCRYIDQMFEFHPGFDTDPWAAGILTNPALKDPSDKTDKLVEAAKRQQAATPAGV